MEDTNITGGFYHLHKAMNSASRAAKAAERAIDEHPQNCMVFFCQDQRKYVPICRQTMEGALRQISDAKNHLERAIKHQRKWEKYND